MLIVEWMPNQNKQMKNLTCLQCKYTLNSKPFLKLQAKIPV